MSTFEISILEVYLDEGTSAAVRFIMDSVGLKFEYAEAYFTRVHSRAQNLGYTV